MGWRGILKLGFNEILSDFDDTSIKWRVVGHKMAFYISVGFPICSIVILWSAGLSGYRLIIGFLLNFLLLLLMILIITELVQK